MSAKPSPPKSATVGFIASLLITLASAAGSAWFIYAHQTSITQPKICSEPQLASFYRCGDSVIWQTDYHLYYTVLIPIFAAVFALYFGLKLLPKR